MSQQNLDRLHEPGKFIRIQVRDSAYSYIRDVWIPRAAARDTAGEYPSPPPPLQSPCAMHPRVGARGVRRMLLVSDPHRRRYCCPERSTLYLYYRTDSGMRRRRMTRTAQHSEWSRMTEERTARRSIGQKRKMYRGLGQDSTDEGSRAAVPSGRAHAGSENYAIDGTRRDAQAAAVAGVSSPGRMMQ